MRRLLAYLGLTFLFILPTVSTIIAQEGIDTPDIDTEACLPDPNEPAPRLFGGARPSSLVLEEVVLLSQPPLTADTVPLEIITIPAGARVIVFDLDELTESYFRVIWPCEEFNFTGWVEIEAIRHNPNRTNTKPAPPGCARAITVVNLLDDVWESTSTEESLSWSIYIVQKVALFTLNRSTISLGMDVNCVTGNANLRHLVPSSSMG